jgi:AbrB family looped-hinge helix DNA binding protein
MTKVTSKYQVTVPKAIADRYSIRPGDEIEWIAAGDAIRVVPGGSATPCDDLAERVPVVRSSHRTPPRPIRSSKARSTRSRPDARGSLRPWPLSLTRIFSSTGSTVASLTSRRSRQPFSGGEFSTTRPSAAYRMNWFDAHLWSYAEHYGLSEIITEDLQHDRLGVHHGLRSTTNGSPAPVWR